MKGGGKRSRTGHEFKGAIHLIYCYCLWLNERQLVVGQACVCVLGSSFSRVVDVHFFLDKRPPGGKPFGFKLLLFAFARFSCCLTQGRCVPFPAGRTFARSGLARIPTCSAAMLLSSVLASARTCIHPTKPYMQPTHSVLLCFACVRRVERHVGWRRKEYCAL